MGCDNALSNTAQEDPPEQALWSQKQDQDEPAKDQHLTDTWIANRERTNRVTCEQKGQEIIGQANQKTSNECSWQTVKSAQHSSDKGK